MNKAVVRLVRLRQYIRVGVLVTGKEVYAMYSTVIDGTTNKSDGVKGEIKAGSNSHQTKNTQEASTSSLIQISNDLVNLLMILLGQSKPRC